MIQVIAVGKVKEKWIKEGCAEYAKRMKHVKIEELKDTTLAKEGKLFLEKIDKAKGTVVALHEQGETMTSVQFARWLQKQEQVMFLIGSADGFDKGVLQKADKKVCLSSMTFLHELARLVLLEQLYRAQCIQKGKTYHR